MIVAVMSLSRGGGESVMLLAGDLQRARGQRDTVPVRPGVRGQSEEMLMDSPGNASAGSCISAFSAGGGHLYTRPRHKGALQSDRRLRRPQVVGATGPLNPASQLPDTGWPSGAEKPQRWG